MGVVYEPIWFVCQGVMGQGLRVAFKVTPDPIEIATIISSGHNSISSLCISDFTTQSWCVDVMCIYKQLAIFIRIPIDIADKFCSKMYRQSSNARDNLLFRIYI